MIEPAETVSFVIPFYDEEAVLDQLLTRLESVREVLSCKAEFVFVNDGSRDGGAEIIRRKAAQDGDFKMIDLSRNFGHQAAICAGMEFARGDYVCLLDADLQDPPELVVDMLAQAGNGADVVYAVRKDRVASGSMRVLYKSYYRILSVLADTLIPIDAGDFCLMSREVVDAILRLPERQRFVRGLRSWVGFNQQPFYYSRPDRAAGAPKYSLRKLLQLGMDGIFAFSSKPLRLATILGLVLAVLCLVYTGYAVVWRFFSGQSLPGFATLAVGVFFLGAVQLISVGILGEYIGRMFYEVKQRPTYIVARKINILE